MTSRHSSKWRQYKAYKLNFRPQLMTLPRIRKPPLVYFFSHYDYPGQPLGQLQFFALVSNYDLLFVIAEMCLFCRYKSNKKRAFFVKSKHESLTFPMLERIIFNTNIGFYFSWKCFSYLSLVTWDLLLQVNRGLPTSKNSF